MLTKKQNLLETIRGGNPDRFVNEYEFLVLVSNPFSATSPSPKRGEMNVANKWGIVRSFFENTPAPIPIHDEVHTVCKDITKWREYVKAPSVIFSDKEWEPFVKQAEAVDRNEYFVAPFIAPGLFEQCHYLLEMQNMFIAFYEEPEYMHELIDYLTDWEIKLADEVCKYLKPTALFHHDDWGSQISSFISPEMFKEFFVPAYKKIYGHYKENGVEIVVHHSDSYAANLVPYMIEMGIDIWQGAMSTNNLPELVKQYGKQISFMGGIDNGIVDREDWTRELLAKEVEKVCKDNGKLYFIPCTTMGGPESLFEGVYTTVAEEIDRMSKIMF